MLRALEDLAATAPDRFADVAGLRRQVEAIPEIKPLLTLVRQGDPAAIQAGTGILDLQRRILLANPLLDFDMVIARKTNNLGLPANFHSNSSLPKTGYQNEIIRFSIHGKEPDKTIFTPEKSRFIGDFCLHFDADRLLFSMPNDNTWQVHEIRTDGSGLRQVSPDIRTGIDNYDACYLPNGEYLFTSTLPLVSVPCVGGGAHVANLVRLGQDGRVRQLCFDQEHNWCPRVLANGTILYQRWEYTDTPHANTRLLMTMNPDGTNQRSFYGSNSYWPSAFFFATPVPGSATRVVGISSGHHGDPRLGELYLLDAAAGRAEGAGATQIPSNPTTPSGKGKTYDHMVNVWPRFLHPQPLDDKYILTACQPSPHHAWGIYLADTFDNLLLLKELPGLAVSEPIPVIKRPTPPVIPDKVDLASKDATIYMQDIYAGPGLKGIPRGTVKSLRVFSYTFSYQNVGGLYGVIGLDGPWDLHRPLGTVPVNADGSAKFTVPANTPISIQPLDANGQALALMRSWLTAMPGETLSCVGCHEDQNATPASRDSKAFTATAAAIKPWRPQTSGFSFAREVQPVLDRRCAGCHDGTNARPDFRGGTMITDWSSQIAGNAGGHGGKFSTSYANLFPYTRANGIEGDYHLLAPMEFHFSTSELGQMLRKGHHGVALDADDMDRLATWIDLNRPYHGSWSSIQWGNARQLEADRSKMRETYANVCENHEDVPADPVAPVVAVVPDPQPAIPNAVIHPAGWPFDAARAKALQGTNPEATLAAAGITIPLVRIPAGEFAMGSATGHRDEQPVGLVKIAKPFLMAKHEISNAQFRKFDPNHDSRVADALNYQFGQRPWSLNADDQPVCRVSFRQALAFCAWLSEQSGKQVTLPTEAEWEWAARAGTDTPFPFGDLAADFSRSGNFADASIARFAACTAAASYHAIRTIPNPGKYDLPLLRDDTHNDGQQLAAPPGGYTANAFGLHDMHGNVAEWTLSRYLPYPYAHDTRNDPAIAGERVVRGGSWWNRPFQCTSSHRAVFQDYQPVMWVGFRVIVRE